MSGRRTAAALLLFAVLSMHGLQCSSAGDAATHSTAGPAISLGLTTAVGGHPAQDHAVAGPSVEDTPVAVRPLAAPIGEHDSAPHGAGHLWAVCLAVLAAGLAVLLTVLGSRLVPRWLAAWKGSRSRAAGVPWLPRPPDLHALCLLRI